MYISIRLFYTLLPQWQDGGVLYLLTSTNLQDLHKLAISFAKNPNVCDIGKQRSLNEVAILYPSKRKIYFYSMNFLKKFSNMSQIIIIIYLKLKKVVLYH